MKKPKFSYDPACETLAEHFLPAEATEEMKRELSQAIQECIESWLEWEMRKLQKS